MLEGELGATRQRLDAAEAARLEAECRAGAADQAAKEVVDEASAALMTAREESASRQMQVEKAQEEL